MKIEKERIPKLVLVPSSIECRSWTLADKENVFQCYTCKSGLFYVRREWGVVDEGPWDHQVIGYKNKDKSFLALREIGLALFCAECGEFNEDYYKYFYPKDYMVCSWDDEDLDIAEKEELMHAIDIFNRTGKIELPYESSQIIYLKEKVKEYFDKKIKGRGKDEK